MRWTIEEALHKGAPSWHKLPVCDTLQLARWTALCEPHFGHSLFHSFADGIAFASNRPRIYGVESPLVLAVPAITWAFITAPRKHQWQTPIESFEPAYLLHTNRAKGMPGFLHCFVFPCCPTNATLQRILNPKLPPIVHQVTAWTS